MTELSELGHGDVRMRRRYAQVQPNGTIEFTVEIEAPTGRVSSTTTLLAVGADEMMMLLDAGFAAVERVVSLSGSGERGGLELVFECRRG